MARSTAVAGDAAARLRRNLATESSESSAAVTPADSPRDSPRPSASSTSLSSLSEMEIDAKPTNYGKLIDTYGNEFTPPDFTIKDIRDAIPKHCFKRSALKGYLYILRDMLYLATTFTAYYNYVTPEYIPNVWVRGALWAVYTFLQGLFGTGLWVIAHECGHGAFSESNFINDVTAVVAGWASELAAIPVTVVAGGSSLTCDVGAAVAAGDGVDIGTELVTTPIMTALAPLLTRMARTVDAQAWSDNGGNPLAMMLAGIDNVTQAADDLKVNASGLAILANAMRKAVEDGFGDGDFSVTSQYLLK
ncbi:hypothetical protein NQ176_g6212 [Zarea fungicola]|uniref:Uncharacterized protein n=1 Tax=Zarea fungicola TaxID=93591 RepID=A0ACC1N6S3_9HYPO|nr:hypothetical protein NQ176_g6212 [Lecanicillium fungicola]